MCKKSFKKRFLAMIEEDKKSRITERDVEFLRSIGVETTLEELRNGKQKKRYIMKTYYKDGCGSYSITEHRDGTATLCCRNNVNYHLDHKKDYNTVRGAQIALARYCGGMPEVVKQ